MKQAKFSVWLKRLRNYFEAATMIAETLNSYSLTLGYLRQLVAELPDDMLIRQPAGIPNHPAWVIGHLVYSCQSLGGEIGLAPWLAADWEQRYGTGSTPTNERQAYPANDELLAAIGDAEHRIRERLLAMTEAELGQPLPDGRYHTMFPTVGHAVLHILVGHTAIHVGQLTVWRRAVGFEPLKYSFSLKHRRSRSDLPREHCRFPERDSVVARCQ